MKFKFTYLLLALIAVAFISGCLGGGAKNNPTPVIPDGSYTGEFRILHVHAANNIDTNKTNIVVNIAPVSSSTYTVTGDTSTLHAGSKGTYTFYPGYSTVVFVDKTYSSTAPVTKSHLTGSYTYYFDGTKFQMTAHSALDTLVLQYDLVKSGN